MSFEPVSAKNLVVHKKSCENVLNKFQKLEEDLNAAFAQRSEEIHCAVLALLSGQTPGRGANTIYIGPPGTAKSAMVEYITSSIENDVNPNINRMFRVLYHQFIKPAEIFGPENVSELIKNHRIVREMENYLPNSLFVLHDEVYKANDAIRNTLLTMLNEGKFQIDGKWFELPVLCHFGTSNEIGKEPAFKDRFLFWFIIKPIVGRNERLEYYKGRQLPSPNVQIALSEIYWAMEEAKKVTITEATYECFQEIYEDLLERNIVISDRRCRQIFNVVQAEAFLQGRMETEPIDCGVLVPCLWNDPKEITDVRNIVLKKANGQLLTIYELVDLVTKTYKMNTPGNAEKYYDQIREIESDYLKIVPLPKNREEYNKGKKTISALKNALCELAIIEKGRMKI